MGRYKELVVPAINTTKYLLTLSSRSSPPRYFFVFYTPPFELNRLPSIIAQAHHRHHGYDSEHDPEPLEGDS